MNLIIDNIKGIAYQEDRTKSIKYDKKYWDKIEKHKEQKDMNHKINEFRSEIVYNYNGIYDVLDIGCGNCEFIKAYNDKYPFSHAYGFDIMKQSVTMLKEMNSYIDLYDDIPEKITAFTFWDSLEHFPEPTKILEKIPKDTYTFICMPIFEDLNSIKASKHYRPNEHYWYFTQAGFESYMEQQDFIFVKCTDKESVLGREEITTFVFRK
jgi:SAM-dependent methyltransferase